MEMAPLFDQLKDVLREHPPVKQQIAIELLMTSHAMRVSKDVETIFFVIDSMAKHAKQLATNIKED